MEVERPSLGVLEAILGVLGGHVGAFLELFGAMLGISEARLDEVGLSSRTSGVLHRCLRGSRQVLEAVLEVWRPRFRILGASLGALGCQLKAIVEVLWAILVSGLGVIEAYECQSC